MNIKSWCITLTLILTLVAPPLGGVYAANPPEAQVTGGRSAAGHSAAGRYGSAALAERVVTITGDTNDGMCDEDCSLREAIAVATAGDTIVFANALTGQTLPLNSELAIAKRLTIDGSSLGTPITLSGQNAVRVFAIAASGVVTLSSLSIVNGMHDDNGGGIINRGTLTVQHCTLSGNSINYGFYGGGGIYNLGTLTIQYSTFSGNSTRDARGGGIYNASQLTVRNSTFSGNSATGWYDAYGGGIYNQGQLTVRNSTFSGNSATGSGGGIYNYGTLTMTNSTLSGNQADYDGGGIHNEGQLTVRHNTLSDNSANRHGGGTYNSGTLNYDATIIANSTSGGDCYNSSVEGTIGTNAYNLVEDGGCSDSAIGFLSGDPLLGPLADHALADNGEGANGMPLLTHALSANSPAIDAAPTASVSTDQRGFPRPYPVGGQYDIGAYEAGPLRLAKMATPAIDAPYHGLVTYTLTLSNTGETDEDSLWLTDTLPSEVSFDSWIIQPANATLVGDEIRWQGELAAGQVLNVSFRVRHTGDYSDHVINLAQFSGTLDRGGGVAGFDVEYPPSYIVQNTNDTGLGSLRRAIALANEGDTIVFASELAGRTILLGSQLDITRTLTIDGSRLDTPITISGNKATRVFNIAASSIVTLSTLNIVSGTTTYGGGVYNEGQLTVQSSTLSGNQVDHSGGGITNEGTLTVTNSTLSSNSAAWDGGGIYNEGTLTLQNSTLSGNKADYGGGIRSANTLTVTNSTFSGNSAIHNGGGIDSFGALTVTNSTFSDNSAGEYGGGISNGGTLAVTNSTLSGNHADVSGGGISNGGTLTVTNSTLSSNSALGNGGGISNWDTLTVQNSTFSSNSADVYGGGIYNQGTLNYENTLIANSVSGGDCYNHSVMGGTIGTNAYNLVENGGCSDGAVGFLTGDPLLGPLADNALAANGGGTWTHELLPNSPAIDAGGNASCLPTDQRGEARNDLRCDIGAFELQFSDSDTVIKSGFSGGTPYSFGPTWISLTLSTAVFGSITVTKHLAYPGGVADPGEMPATWWITDTLNTGWPATLSLCYTDAEIDGLLEASLRAFRWDGLQWTDPISTGLTVDEAANCVTLTGIEQFSAWTLKDVSTGGSPTAVTLREFSAGTARALPLLGTLVLLGALALVRRRK